MLSLIGALISLLSTVCADILEKHGQVACAMPCDATTNPLHTWFDNYKVGPQVWKWTHYFNVYHQHFCRYRQYGANGPPVVFLEVGIQSGGAINMWREYFGGSRLRYFGIDINPACKQFESASDGVRVFIGDQSNETWWRTEVLPHIPPVDIFNDDGSHVPTHQERTFRAVYDKVKSDGIYMVEDTHGGSGPHTFVTLAMRLIAELYNQRHGRQATPFSKSTLGISFYESIVVFEKSALDPDAMRSLKKGDYHVPCSTNTACE